MANDDYSILVVDSLESEQNKIVKMLTKAGHEDVRTATDGKQALGMLTEKRADIVLADWIIPDMDGQELTNQIRQQDEDFSHYTAIMLFTAEEGIKHLETALESGADDFLNKPLNQRELAARTLAAG